MRSRVCLALCSLLSLMLCTTCIDLNQIQVYPENSGTFKVFIVRRRNQPYSFNATTAVDICTSLGVGIASRAQVETALRNGLQTCRYGWVKENVAVIPRIERKLNCGQNQVGIILWVTPMKQLFDVFCYNSTGETEATPSTTPNMTPVSNGRPHAKPTSPSLFLSTQPNKNFFGSSSSPQFISTGFNTSMTPTVFSSAVTPMTTKSFQTSTSDISLSSAAYQLSNSSSSSSSSFSSSSFFSTELSTLAFTNSFSEIISSNKTNEQLPPGKGISFGAVSIACIIVLVMLVMMAGTGAVWYFKIKRPHRLSSWERICHKDMFETEMWTEQEHFSMQNDSVNCGGGGGGGGGDITLQLKDDSISS